MFGNNLWKTNKWRVTMVITLSDFNKLSEKDKKETLEKMKQEVGVSGIAKEWEISRSKAYSLLHDLNISVNRKIKKPSKTKNRNKPNNILDDRKTDISSQSTTAKQQVGQLRKNITKQSLDFDSRKDSSKFSLYLETQGTSMLIDETLHKLLGSENLTNFNLHVEIKLQEL